MSIYLEKVQKIIGDFEDEDKQILIKHYVQTSRNVLLDEKEVKKSKLSLLGDLHAIGGKDEVNAIVNDVLDHKILQIRALILDLVDDDYTSDSKVIGRPEKWIKRIIEDAEETFSLDSEFGKRMFSIYNEKLLEEFCKIFISENRKFGTGGNQLLLNFYYYERFVQSKIEFDFQDFFSRMTSSFKDHCYRSKEELEKILDGK
ncbi:hypothetical protein KMI_11g16890 [Encephalitozoon hellem]|uniref:Uncharacterized protein n=1 Tax=Encephalitozoon hellem TaxID=27973 RepID=A0A9Q9CBM4_ENCHE|nr:uncharacterized protein EHEL_090100 [Encephalitozoon hellem ATCC 50504]AFM98906.1 hypothetical protein EHEL_090100 [Encephalitozoon hellem ATCC 50504]KAG5858734.1 hypothetical protein KMI_11g16890 [Encephalitozoon hellem]UTX43918.1 hypothetical protein GPU96_09g16980 [Encephalitozoon hellem]|eukprot:XP_003887887.1 hypothetical protein EHEL_090100 [Encephalitozoon hellem ATCC 50504]